MANNHSHDAEKSISTAFWLNAVFVVIEAVGGLLTNSIAILSDALHDFGDTLSLALSWFLQKKSKKAADSKYTYGYKRFSLLGTVFLSGVLFISSAWVIYAAIGRICSPSEVDAKGMVWLAIVGVVINGAAALRVNRGHSLSERAVFLHIMEDVLGLVAVLVTAIVMIFFDVPILDPILSIVISVWVLFNVIRNMRDTGIVFLQATPKDIPVDKLKEQILELPDVESVHDVHIWSLDGDSHVMSLHVVSFTFKTQSLKQQIYDIASQYHISHVTVDIEKPGTNCTYKTTHK